MEDKIFAVLVDADNTSYRYIKTVIDELEKEGVANIRRIYGDWSRLSSMREAALDNAFVMFQQTAYTSGLNSTDGAMIIDAMDILYSGNVDGFCLVSSDSDFTRLAQRLREAGKTVIGMGRKGTPKAFVVSCDRFVYLDVLTKEEKTEPKVEAKPTAKAPTKKKPKGKPAAEEKPLDNSKLAEKVDPVVEPIVETTRETTTIEEPTAETESSITPISEIHAFLTEELDASSDDDGWMLLSELGHRLQRRFNDYDPRLYGCKKTLGLLEKLETFEFKSIPDPNNKAVNGKLVYVRNRT